MDNSIQIEMIDRDAPDVSEAQADHFRMQGAVWMFFTLLQGTDDTDLIYSMHLKIAHEHYDVQVNDRFFLVRYIKEYAECNYINFKMLCDKLIWVFKESNAENELTNLGLE